MSVVVGEAGVISPEQLEKQRQQVSYDKAIKNMSDENLKGEIRRLLKKHAGHGLSMIKGHGFLLLFGEGFENGNDPYRLTHPRKPKRSRIRKKA